MDIANPDARRHVLSPPPPDRPLDSEERAKRHCVADSFFAGAVLIALGYWSYCSLKGDKGVLFRQPGLRDSNHRRKHRL